MDTPLQRQITEEKFDAIRHQEDTFYHCEDYLAPGYQKRQLEERYSGPNAVLFESLPSDPSAGTINQLWREKICEWSYQVADHFDLSREIVAISISYLDRFLETRRVNKKVFQLAAMTCLYLASKINEANTLSMQSLIGLSRGFFTSEHIVAMEESILRALDWLLNPPTVIQTVGLYVSLLNPEICHHVRIDIFELARFLSELSVCDYFFVTRKISSVGLACVLTAFEGISHDVMPRKYRQQFVNDVYNISKVNCTIEEVHSCRIRLRNIYERGNYAHTSKNSSSSYAHHERGSGGRSPNVIDGGNTSEQGSVSNAQFSVGENMTSTNATSVDGFAPKPVQMMSSYVSADVDMGH